MAVIAIGSSAIDRASSASVTSTMIMKDNPANLSGKITSVQIYAAVTIENCEVGIFEQVDTDVFTTRSNAALGQVVQGATRTFEVDLDVAAGDFIGIYGTEGSIDRSDSEGGLGIWYKAGDYIPCTSEGFTFWTGHDRIYSLYGSGEEVSVGVSTGGSMAAKLLAEAML